MGTTGNKKAHSDTGAVGNVKIFDFRIVHDFLPLSLKKIVKQKSKINLLINLS
jgi:hypothetical protein